MTIQRVMCYTYSVFCVILPKYHGMHGYETRVAGIATGVGKKTVVSLAGKCAFSQQLSTII